MRQTLLIFLGLALTASGSASGAITDSVADFSDIQGTAHWSYGIYRQTAPGVPPSVSTPHGYSAEAFRQLDIFFEGQWIASDALVGANNNDFLRITATSAHPTGFGPGGQNQVIWAVRRWVSPLAGTVAIDFHVAKENVTNPSGRGVTARVFVDGADAAPAVGIANTDAIGADIRFVRTVSVGTILDFAIDPLGVGTPPGTESIYSARADGTLTSITISAVPEPASALLMLAGLPLLLGAARRLGTRPTAA